MGVWDRFHKFENEQLEKLGKDLMDWQGEPEAVISVHKTCRECFKEDFIQAGRIPNIGSIVFIVSKGNCQQDHAEQLED